jgi:hypothetical protein
MCSIVSYENGIPHIDGARFVHQFVVDSEGIGSYGTLFDHLIELCSPQFAKTARPFAIHANGAVLRVRIDGRQWYTILLLHLLSYYTAHALPFSSLLI